jgi:hypothetical protein
MLALSDRRARSVRSLRPYPADRTSPQPCLTLYRSICNLAASPRNAQPIPLHSFVSAEKLRGFGVTFIDCHLTGGVTVLISRTKIGTLRNEKLGNRLPAIKRRKMESGEAANLSAMNISSF